MSAEEDRKSKQTAQQKNGGDGPKGQDGLL